MRVPLTCLLGLGLCAWAATLSAEPAVLSGGGWNFNRSQLREIPLKIEAAKTAVKGIPIAGWIEYDISVPAAGWYELWLGGTAPEWPHDVYLDGEVVSRLGYSTGADKPENAPKSGAQFKELNMYVGAGKHRLRFQRWGAPGSLPTAWELRPAIAPAGTLRVVPDASRVTEPGGNVVVKVLGGAPGPATGYELILRNEATDAEFPAGKLEFPPCTKPIEKTVTLTLPEAGLYSLLAKSGGQWLRPADLKGGLFLSAKAEPRRSLADSQKFQFMGFFQDGVVLQREKPLPVWGWGKPGAAVTVALAGQTESAQADATGRWQITFKPLQAGGPFELRAETTGEKPLVCKDVMVGEVWLLSGQSNMGGSLASAPGGVERGTSHEYPDVRSAEVFSQRDASGQFRLNPTGWPGAAFGGDAKKFGKWRPIHYTFGTEIAEALKVPVGVIAGNRGGTTICSWTSMDIHQTEPGLKELLQTYEEDQKAHVPELVMLNRALGTVQKWRKTNETALAEGKPAAALPELRTDPTMAFTPAAQYDQFIAPMAPFAIRGVLWYQGESDSNMAEAYEPRFAALVKNWREIWHDPKLPFLFVQIAYGKGDLYTGEPVEFQGAELKDVQRKTLSVPYTAMAVTNDLQKPGDDVHYPDKIPVGHRLALAALANVYGQKGIEFSGPLYKGMKIEGGKVRLSFDHAEGGLVAKGDKLKGFSIAGEDRKWVWAEAAIDGETVLVSSPQVPHPAAVRYSWAESPIGANLFNRADLPCAVFRTDNWPALTTRIWSEHKN